jgi:mono/diheme cytochrome c family protein
MRALLPALLLLAACSGGEQTGLSPLAQEGERVYQNVCIACHNGDPTRKGSLGPAIAGSSEELLHARVIEGTYPEGYSPKQPGGVMPRFEYLEPQIPALAAYLAEVGEAEAGAAEGS